MEYCARVDDILYNTPWEWEKRGGKKERDMQIEARMEQLVTEAAEVLGIPEIKEKDILRYNEKRYMF
jgi:hypothetical protein